jgi:hypothetical protein
MEQDSNKLEEVNEALSIVDPLVKWIKAKRLETPATLFLEMHRPLMPLAWPAAVMCGTFLAPFFGPDYYEKIEALRDPAALDRLLARLAARDGEGGNGIQHKEH